MCSDFSVAGKTFSDSRELVSNLFRFSTSGFTFLDRARTNFFPQASESCQTIPRPAIIFFRMTYRKTRWEPTFRRLNLIFFCLRQDFKSFAIFFSFLRLVRYFLAMNRSPMLFRNLVRLSVKSEKF